VNKEIIEKKTNDISSYAQSLQVIDKDTNEMATHYLQTIKNLKSEVDNAFDPIIKANHKAWKGAIAQKKIYENPLKEAESNVKRKMRTYLEEEEKKRAELQKKIEKEAEKEGIDAPEIKTQKTENQVTRYRYYVEITDKKKIPLEYLEPNIQMLNAIARAKKEKMDIPGVAVKKEIIVGIRS